MLKYYYLIAVLISGCASEDLYNLGISSRQQECQKLIETEARTRCLNQAEQSYQRYQQQQTER